MIQEKDLKIGMKVKIPKTKSVFGAIEYSNVIKEAITNKQDYLFYTGKGYNDWIRLDTVNSNSGDFFGLEDLELYEEPFVLPEKWKVKVTEENKDILTDWKLKVSENLYYKRAEKYKYITNDGSGDNIGDYQELLSWEQFKKHVLKEETMKLPTENFGIKVVNENAFEIVHWFKDKKYNTKNYDGNASNDYIYWTKEDKNIDCTSLTPPDIKIYTLEEIKQIENQTKNNMGTKELLGYKLIKPEYKEAALKISRVSEFSKSSEYDFVNDSVCARSLKEAGVLDLWFEKVFKEEEFKIGEWVSFYSETNKKLHTAKIRKLGSSYHYLSDGTEPFVHLLRKATEEEIEAATCKTVKLSIGKNVDIERDKLSNQVYILAEGKIIQYKHINNLYCNTNTFGDTNWKIQYNTFDIGCWKNVTRDDLKLIIDAYEEINAKLK